jgi:ABC-type oligopeptide transport system substrate-binding subunit
MKKVLFAFAVIASLSFAACNGNKTTSTGATTDSLAVATDSTKIDSLQVNAGEIVDTVATDKK